MRATGHHPFSRYCHEFNNILAKSRTTWGRSAGTSVAMLAAYGQPSGSISPAVRPPLRLIRGQRLPAQRASSGRSCGGDSLRFSTPQAPAAAAIHNQDRRPGGRHLNRRGRQSARAGGGGRTKFEPGATRAGLGVGRGQMENGGDGGIRTLDTPLERITV